MIIIGNPQYVNVILVPVEKENGKWWGEMVGGNGDVLNISLIFLDIATFLIFFYTILYAFLRYYDAGGAETCREDIDL